ncbi:HPr family phosphocarrier protein [Streptomyces sp. NPDC102462]|uniref:HPr family phosphocarrier protein n=1 Tax=Streptomyces sp. NPDC102462 TaxID=3366178 RepID=UPI0038193CC7
MNPASHPAPTFRRPHLAAARPCPRPAAQFTQTVLRYGVPVLIGREGGAPIDASSVLQVMGLAVKHDEAVVLSCEAPGADQVLDDLATLLATDLDAE